MTTAIGSYATAAALKTRMGLSDSTDDTLLGTICDQVNGFIESPAACGRPIAPITSATYTLDGDGSRVLRYPRGIRAVTLLELAEYTGAAFTTIASTDYFLRPQPSELIPGWPYTRIEMSDRPAGSFSTFPRGYGTVRMTATTGWAAIPDEITDVALTAATRAWHGRQSGQQDIVGTDEMGERLISRFFSARDLYTLRAYSVNLP